MKVSIITATFNSEEVVSDCIKSLLDQDYPDIEIVVIDGASSDKTVQIVKGLSSNFSNIRLFSEPDFGIYDALNKGLKIANGDIIGFLHSDDILCDSSIISKIIKGFSDNSIDGVYGDLNYVDKNEISKIIRRWKSKNFNQKLLARGWMPAHPTLFLKRNVYDKYGDFNTSYRISADYDFILRIFSDNTLNFRYLPFVFTNMRIGGASNKSVKNILKKTHEDFRALKSNKIGGLKTVLLKNISKIGQFINF